jgi:hypothetical protein
MALLDFQNALGRLVRTSGSDQSAAVLLAGEERACLEALPKTAGFRFTVAVQRSWCVRRAANAGLLALSILPDETRRQLLDTWIDAGGGTSSFFASEADALLDFIADQLPEHSPELAVCRLEQLILRANSHAAFFKSPDQAIFDVWRSVRRGSFAGVVDFHGRPDQVLNGLLRRGSQEGTPQDVTPVLVAPGLQALCRIALPHEAELWKGLEGPAPAAALVARGQPRGVIETMLNVGALEYA